MQHHCTVCQQDASTTCTKKGHLTRCERNPEHAYAPSRNSRGCPYCLNEEAKKLNREAAEAGESTLTSAEKRKQEARLAKEAEYAQLTKGKKKVEGQPREQPAESAVREQ